MNEIVHVKWEEVVTGKDRFKNVKIAAEFTTTIQQDETVEQAYSRAWKEVMLQIAKRKQLAVVVLNSNGVE